MPRPRLRAWSHHVAAVCVLVLAGCAQATSPQQVLPPVYVEPPVISPAAVQAYGEAPAREAYDELADFVLANAFPQELLDPQQEEYTGEQLSADVPLHLTPGATETWSSQVAAATAGVPAAQEGVRIMRFHGWDQPTWTLVEGEQPLESQRITGAEIDLDGPPTDLPLRLRVRLDHSATVRLQEDATPFELVVAKSMTYWLVPSPETSGPRWLIDQYDGSYVVRPPGDPSAPP